MNWASPSIPVLQTQPFCRALGNSLQQRRLAELVLGKTSRRKAVAIEMQNEDAKKHKLNGQQPGPQSAMTEVSKIPRREITL